MPFAINTNVASLQAQNYLRVTNDFQAKTIARVTSGLRIVNSGDDAAGLAIANGYRSDEAVLTQGVRNANDGLSQLQTADGGISNISQLLDRARTLATQSSSGAFTGDRTVLNSEFQSVVGEINRQAQAIGLVQGGTLAKALNIFIGGGQTANGVTAASNGTLALDLSHSTVDATSLGLKGVQAIGTKGTDIGAGSATTSLGQILANTTNTGSVSTPGFATLIVKGPGFDGNGVKLIVNTANLGGTADLVAAVNAAISAAGNGGTQQATALKNANIVAAVNTDVSGGQQLTFSSSNTAFQVEAGDRVANGLLGNFEQNATLKGTDTAATLATNGGGTSARLTLAVDGALTPINVDITTSATESKAQVVKDLNLNAGFSAVAVAHLEGDQIVLRSKGNNASSSIQLTATTLATNLGLSTTKAAAASASTGADLSTYVTAATETAAGSSTFGAAGAGAITFRFQGAGETTPTDVSINVVAGTTVAQAITALGTAVANNAALKGTGISLTTTSAGDALTFTSSKGEKFDVQVSGDVQNKLGFGSFLTGTAGAVDYSTLSGNSTYDNSGTVGTNFGAGTATFEVSLNGQASSTHSIAVNLAQGDATAAAVTSTDSTTSPVGVTANNNTLNLTVNGASFNVALAINGASTKNDVANQINTVISGQGTATVVNNAIVLTSNTKGAGGTIQVEGGTANTLLGFTAADPVKGVSRSGASIAQAVNQAIAADSVLSAAGLVADFNVTAANKLTIKSASGNGTFFRVDARGSSAAAAVVSSKDQVSTAALAATSVSSGTGVVTTDATHNNFKLTIDSGVQTTINLGQVAGRTLGSVVSELNANSIFTGLGATASLDGTGHLVISSNTTGAGSHVQIAAGATNDVTGTLGLTVATTNGAANVNGYAITGGSNDQVSISVDGGTAQVFTLTAGATRTAANIVSDLSGLTGAVASVDANNHVVITSSSTGTGSSVVFNTHANSAYGTLGFTASTSYIGTAADTGYGVTGATFTGNVQSAAPATSGTVDAGGSSQSSALAFTPVLYGGDDQTVTVAAGDTNGVQQSLSITLRNDAVARNARSIDEAVSTINTQLEQTNNKTLQNIVAVKDNSSGTETIRFLSTAPSFQVSIGTTANATGIGSQGTTNTSTVVGQGANADISTISGAAAAVTALASAVSALGKAQAVIGRGQNQLNYAVNLASSQLTNLAAAESRIRDADLAAESANLTKSQLLLQAGIAALAQANSAPQQVLKLLQ